MKRLIQLIFCGAFLLLLSVQSHAQKANISFKSEVHDFGTIKEEDGPKSCVFTFTNTGKAPLVISDVRASCGCTTPEWTKSPVLPGKTGIIKATYDPKGRPHPFDKTITVTSNAEKSSVVLHIKGMVQAKVFTIEEQFPHVVGDLRLKSGSIELARIKAGASRTENIEVYNSSSVPIILSFENVPEQVNLTADPISIPAKQKGKITCVYNSKKTKEFGPISEVVRLKAGSAKGELKINVTIDEDFSALSEDDHKNAPILADIPGANLNVLKKGEKGVAKFKLTNDGKTDLIIRKVYSKYSFIKPNVQTLTIKPGETSTIEFTVDTSTEEPGSKYYTVVLTTNSPKKSQVNLNISTTIK